MNIKSVIIGTGSYLPKKILNNHELAKLVDTSDEWITERTGIKERHVAAANEFSSDLGYEAALKALKASETKPNEIDLVIVATTTPDNSFPATATKIQSMLGIKTAAAFDIQAVCSGFIYALSIADNFIKTGQYKKIIVIGVDTLTRLIDWNDRATCILFGDGAGAVILSATKAKSNKGILSTHLYSDGSGRDLLYVDGGISSKDEKIGKIRMKGKEVFKHAVQKLAECTLEAIKYNKFKIDDVDWFIPHQANIRILHAMMEKLNVSKDKLISTVDIHGNTSAASIALAFDKAIRDKKIKPGDLVALQAIGGGLTWGSCLVRV